MYVAAGEPSGKATASLICGIFFFILPVAIAAIIFGHIALSEIKHSGGRLIGEGRALAGLVLGYMGIAIIPFVMIVAAIAIPNLLRARMAANEASAVGSLRNIVSAEASYLNSYHAYTCSLSALGGNPSRPTPDGAGLIAPQLAAGVRSGYRFRLDGCEGGNGATYQALATPLTPGTTGQRTFCTDESGVIRFTPSFTESAEECLATGTPLR